MRELNVKTTDCSGDKLLGIAKRCGFIDACGKKHYKIKTVEGKFVATIPRSNSLSKFTAKGILERFNMFGANIIIS